MTVKRIVTNIKSADPAKAQSFYGDLFGLSMLMDQGWIRTYGADSEMPIQLSIASQGGSDTEVPDLSIEVDDLDAMLKKAKSLNIAIEYGPVTEPWGVKRFYIRDPFGKLINVMQHE